MPAFFCVMKCRLYSISLPKMSKKSLQRMRQ